MARARKPRSWPMPPTDLGETPRRQGNTLSTTGAAPEAGITDLSGYAAEARN